MNTYWEAELLSHAFLISVVVVSGQLHAPSVLLLKKFPYVCGVRG
jgi:hypothetical protein